MRFETGFFQIWRRSDHNSNTTSHHQSDHYTATDITVNSTETVQVPGEWYNCGVCFTLFTTTARVCGPNGHRRLHEHWTSIVLLFYSYCNIRVWMLRGQEDSTDLLQCCQLLLIIKESSPSAQLGTTPGRHVGWVTSLIYRMFFAQLKSPNYLRPSLFCDVTQHTLMVGYWCSETV